ncbi:hypothetical protein ZWY2020_020344 [Hordeum vulgare]|nr:hypothetical protein ZWY2020_020344 [Hordeum vulgare]
MEAGSRRAEGDLCTAQESSEDVARRGGAMRTRVCARVGTPQGVGALLLVGGAIVGAAVLAWRRRGDGKDAKKDHRCKEDDVLDGGVVESEQVWPPEVSLQKSDQSDENLGREDREVEADGLDGKEAEELHEIQEQVDEIVADELDSEPTDNSDPNASKERAETVNDVDIEDVKNPDQNPVKSCVEDEVTPNATEGVKNSDDSALTINSPEIAHEEHIGQSQETASTRMVAHQSQISEQLKVDTMTEIATVENVLKHEEEKPPAQEPVAPINSPVCPSLPALFKPAEKKRPANMGRNETGMKLGQDGGSKKAAEKGVAVVTMDRRAASMAILAIIFAMTIGANVIMRLYSTLRAA